MLLCEGSNKENCLTLTFLPHNKILDLWKLKASIHNKIKQCDWKTEICFWNDINIMGKGDNAGYHHFLLLPPCFVKLSLLGLFEVKVE